MRLVLSLVLTVACVGEPPVEPPPEPVVVPAPEAVDTSLGLAVPVEVDPAFGTQLASLPELASSYEAAVATLRKPGPAAERVARVAALRAKAMSDVPAEDGSSLALREAYDEAIADALGAFFLSYARHIVGSEQPSDAKAEQLEALEAVLMKSGWDWDLASRDTVQAQLMMALRSAG